MQFLHYVFYSPLSLQKHRVHVKGHQNNPQKQKDTHSATITVAVYYMDII